MDSSAWTIHLDLCAISRERLVDGIVDGLEHHVMKAGAVIGVADKHTGPFAHGLKAL